MWSVARQEIVAQRRQHVQALSERYAITCEYQPRGISHGRANPERRRVLIPRTTKVRSYYLALHEIGHCVLGNDHEQPAASQEAATWQWAIEHAIEPPSVGLKRLMFKTVWNYLLSDLAAPSAENLSNAEMFPRSDDGFWSFLASLDDASRLLYEATKITAHTGPPAEARLEVSRALYRERERSREALRRARVREQLRFYGPARPAPAGELTLLGASEKAHVWGHDGMWGTFGSVLCGSRGVAHPAPPGAPRCKTCRSLSM